MRKFVFNSGLVLVTCLATGVATALAPLPRAAAEEEVVVNLPVYNLDPVTVNATIDLGDVTGIAVDIPAGQGGGQVATQCVDIPGVGRSCIGSPTGVEQPPLDVSGGLSLYPLVKWSAAARGALDWMIPDGIAFVSGLYDLPKDDRILKYARPELRSYIVARLLGIMKTKAQGLPLTENEQNALSYIEGERIKQNRLVAKYAWEELQIYDAQQCGYKIPAAPKSITKPETMPDRITTYCRALRTTGPATMTDMPPRPSATNLTAWGAYRHQVELGLSLFSDPIAVKNLTDMKIVAGAYGGFAAGGLALATGVMIANAAAIGKAILPHLVRATFKAGADAIQGMSAAGAGLLSTAIIAAVVVVFLVVTGVAIYLLIERESVADTLYARKKDTEKETDPFDLIDSKRKTPAYEDPAVYNALALDVAKWTTMANEPAPGVPDALVKKPIADPEALWPSNATGADDTTWMVTTGDAKAPVEQKTLSVPVRGGKFATVRFSDGWMIVKEPDKDAQAALMFSYRDRWDTPSLVTGAPGTPTGMVVTNLDARGEPSATRTKTISFFNAKGDLVRARLKGPAPTYLAGPRPVAVGPLTTGRPAMLRPNPVGVNGASLDEATVLEDYTFDWTVEHLDPATGQWSPVHTSNEYGTRFVPTAPGAYDARVTMTSIDDPTQKRFGKVEFTVTAPPITAPVSVLQDNGLYNLELDLQFAEDVPQDDVTVDVTWPGQLGGPDVEQTLDLPCFQTGPIDCTTQRTGPSNLLQFTADRNTDLHRPVVVEVSNSAGGTYRQEFLIGAGRPTFAQSTAADNAGQPGTVVVTASNTQVTFPLAEGTQDYKVAELVPSPGGGQAFGLVNPTSSPETTTGSLLIDGLGPNGRIDVAQDPGTGKWWLYVQGRPTTADLGTFDVPLRVRQTNGTQQLLNVQITVAPTTKDRFRGAIQSSLDPGDIGTATLPKMYPVVLGGRATDAAYNGRMCVSLQHRDFGKPAKVRCGPVKDFTDASGRALNLPYAKLFPSGMQEGSYEADAWLATPGARVDTSHLGFGFFLEAPANYPRPKVGLGKVAIKGKAVVGRKLRVGKLSTDPSGAKRKYQWLRDGKKIAGAHASSYKLKPKDRDDRISVRVVVRYPEWRGTTKVSAKTKRVR